MRLSRFACLMAALAPLCLGQQQAQQPQRGSVSGTVMSVAGEPLKNATLRLQPQAGGGGNLVSGPLPEPYAATTDAQGDFLFDDLDPGSYTLTAQRTSYLNASYSKGNAPLERIAVGAGQSVTGIAIKMTPQAVITGRILNEDGDPVPNAQVMVGRWSYQNGRKRLVNQGMIGQSNFEGTYAVGNLPSGSYIVSVSPPNQGNFRQKGAIETLPQTYYPGVTDPASATAIPVTAGAVLRGTDIRVRKVRAYRIRGTVAGNAGANGFVQLMPLGGADVLRLGGAAGATVRDGAFEIDGVLPGVYALEARPANVRGSESNNDMARQTVSVGNQDVDNVVLQLGPGAEIKGQISYEGSPPPQTQQQDPRAGAQPIVQLVPADGQGFSSGASRIGGDGTFEMKRVMPGSYQAQVMAVPSGTYVKSIRYGGQDVTRSIVEVSGSGGEMQVTLSYNVADISGVVHTSDGQPATGITLTLWNPGVPPKDAIDFTRTVNTDSNGAFKFSDLPPGDYRVAAWEKIDQGLGTVPEFRMNFEAKAASVKLNEGDHAQVDAPLIPSSDIEPEAAKLR